MTDATGFIETEGDYGIGNVDDYGGVVGLAPAADVVATTQAYPDANGAISVGPLRFETPPGETAVIESVEFMPELDSSGFLGLAAVGGLAAATEGDEDATATRREAVVLFGAAVAGSAMAVQAAASETEYPAVEITLSRNDTVTKLSIIDAVDELLPKDVEYYIDYGSRRVDTMDPASSGHEGRFAVSGTGTFRIYVEDAASRLQRLRSSLNGIIGGPETVTLEYELEEPAAEIADQDDPIAELAEHPAVTTAVQDAGRSDMTMRVGGVSIPHEDETWGADAGEYRVEERDEQLKLVYEAGSDAPDSKTVELEVWVGRIANTSDRIDRLTN